MKTNEMVITTTEGATKVHFISIDQMIVIEDATDQNAPIISVKVLSPVDSVKTTTGPEAVYMINTEFKVSSIWNDAIITTFCSENLQAAIHDALIYVIDYTDDDVYKPYCSTEFAKTLADIHEIRSEFEYVVEVATSV